MRFLAFALTAVSAVSLFFSPGCAAVPRLRDLGLGRHRKTATPGFSPAAGTYASSQTVAINDAIAGATYPALYLFGQMGNTLTFYRSIDGGATWVPISDAAHQYGNASLLIGDPRTFGRVYIGTNGNGIFYGDSPN